MIIKFAYNHYLLFKLLLAVYKFVQLTPASAAAVRGANFATAKFRDAYGSPLEAIVMCFFTVYAHDFKKL